MNSSYSPDKFKNQGRNSVGPWAKWDYQDKSLIQLAMKELFEAKINFKEVYEVAPACFWFVDETGNNKVKRWKV